MGVRPLSGQRAIFLDRDGVLNDAVMRDGKPYPPDTVEEVHVSEGAAEALAALKRLGLPLIVVTNQPDVARGKQSREVVDAIHARLAGELPIDAFLSCMHDGDACGCRKPKPGLLIEGAARFDAELSRSFLIGDRWRDVEAGQAAGCRTVWIDRQYSERGPKTPPDARVRSLQEAVSWIIGQIDSEKL